MSEPSVHGRWDGAPGHVFGPVRVSNVRGSSCDRRRGGWKPFYARVTGVTYGPGAGVVCGIEGCGVPATCGGHVYVEGRKRGVVGGREVPVNFLLPICAAHNRDLGMDCDGREVCPAPARARPDAVFVGIAEHSCVAARRVELDALYGTGGGAMGGRARQWHRARPRASSFDTVDVWRPAAEHVSLAALLMVERPEVLSPARAAAAAALAAARCSAARVAEWGGVSAAPAPPWLLPRPAGASSLWEGGGVDVAALGRGVPAPPAQAVGSLRLLVDAAGVRFLTAAAAAGAAPVEAPR